MSAIGHADHMVKTTEQVRLGVNSSVAKCLMRANKNFALAMHSYCVRNKGKGNVTVELKKRGKTVVVDDRNVLGLQVGSSQRVAGSLANRRITPKTILIVDGSGTPQKVEDLNGDGKLWQTDGATGPNYPIEIGTVDYDEGLVDFTVDQAITTSLVADFKHTDWSSFGTAITTTLVAGGGEKTHIFFGDKTAMQNLRGEMRDEEEIGWFGSLVTSTRSEFGLEANYQGDDSELGLPLTKGEFRDKPFHTH